MSWKKAVFYGGAVLVLAACDNATAPNSPALTKIDGISASTVKKTAAVPTSTSADSTTNNVSSPANCSGFVIHVGLDGTLTLVCAPTEW